MTLLVAPLLLSHVLVEVPSSKALLLAQSWRSSPAVAAKPELGLNIDAISEATTAFTEDAPLLFSALRLARKPQAERTAVFASLSEDTGASALSLVECLDKQWSVLALAVAPSLSHADTVEAEASTLASLTERCREYGAKPMEVPSSSAAALEEDDYEPNFGGSLPPAPPGGRAAPAAGARARIPGPLGALLSGELTGAAAEAAGGVVPTWELNKEGEENDAPGAATEEEPFNPEFNIVDRVIAERPQADDLP